MHSVHGKIFTWTFKGEVYIRKNVTGAPKKKIVCEDDLTNIKNGSVCIDPPNINVNDVNDHIYVYDDETPASVPRNNDERTTAVIEAMSTLNICR